MVDGDQLGAVRKGRFHLNVVDHFRHAFHDVVAGKQRRAVTHQFGYRPAIAGAFDSGVAIPDMARKHARTQGSIRLRLEKLGKLPPSGEARFENPPIAA